MPTQHAPRTHLQYMSKHQFSFNPCFPFSAKRMKQLQHNTHEQAQENHHHSRSKRYIRQDTDDPMDAFLTRPREPEEAHREKNGAQHGRGETCLWWERHVRVFQTVRTEEGYVARIVICSHKERVNTLPSKTKSRTTHKKCNTDSHKMSPPTAPRTRVHQPRRSTPYIHHTRSENWRIACTAFRIR